MGTGDEWIGVWAETDDCSETDDEIEEFIEFIGVVDLEEITSSSSNVKTGKLTDLVPRDTLKKFQ